jgi:predicted transcriptional regulator
VAVPARIESYRRAGKKLTSVALDESLIEDLQTIADRLGKSRGVLMEETLRDYVNDFPAVHEAMERAKAIERAWCREDLETLKRLQIQYGETDAQFAHRFGMAERTWIAYREGRAISFAVLWDALRKHPELLDDN